jgi:hypothetical protein
MVSGQHMARSFRLRMKVFKLRNYPCLISILGSGPDRNGFGPGAILAFVDAFFISH